MKIAVLAWGSLVWDRRDLHLATDLAAIGPELPVEFCRVSRDGRLTLVIDETVGVPCVTYAASSAFQKLDAAVENLRAREGMLNAKPVGFLDRRSSEHNARAMERHPQSAERINAWTVAHGYDAVIWTALGANFSERRKANMPFSVQGAVRYLEMLNAKALREALSYIRRAPPEVQTPVRTAVAIRWPER